MFSNKFFLRYVAGSIAFASQKSLQEGTQLKVPGTWLITAEKGQLLWASCLSSKFVSQSILCETPKNFCILKNINIIFF